MGKVYVLRKSAEKHSRNMLLFTTIIIGSVFGLAACNNDADEETPLQEDNNSINDNGVNDSGVNDNGMNNGTGDDGVIDGVDTNQNDNNTGGTTNNNINEGTNPNNDSFKDEADKVIDETEDAIRGEDGNKKPE